ncbi:MAG: hypothetical protein WBP72_09790 [Rhodocyclaceae bacterium]
MITRTKPATVSILLAALLSGPLAAQADVSPKQVLDKVYGNYDKKHGCWIAVDTENDQRYCMKLDRSDKVSAENGQRLYVLVAGDAVDERGEPNGSHASAGMVGAFVVEQRGNAAEIVSGDAKILAGASGSGPTKWKFVKLGPADYWGWLNSAGDCHQGYCGSRYVILAPYGKKIRDLAGIVESYSDAGACGDKRCERKSSSLETKLEIDATRIDEKVFPLLVTVSGQDKGKRLAPKTWTVPFDAAKWNYAQPANWPLRDREF